MFLKTLFYFHFKNLLFYDLHLFGPVLSGQCGHALPCPWRLSQWSKFSRTSAAMLIHGNTFNSVAVCLHFRRQYSSQYLPVVPAPSSPATSRDSSRDNSRRAKDSKSRQSESIANPKRRSTMNSRDAAYDEEEQLRRAIEESKEDTQPAAEDITVRRGKRSRSDSEA